MTLTNDVKLHDWIESMRRHLAVGDYAKWDVLFKRTGRRMPTVKTIKEREDRYVMLNGSLPEDRETLSQLRQTYVRKESRKRPR